MTDKQFQTLLDRLHTAHKKYDQLLKKAENEIVNRYGIEPANNDVWVDKYYMDPKPMTTEEVRQSMEEFKQEYEL